MSQPFGTRRPRSLLLALLAAMALLAAACGGDDGADGDGDGGGGGEDVAAEFECPVGAHEDADGTVEVTVWSRATLVDSDALDVYYATNPSSPSWSYLGTLLPSGSGVRVLSSSVTLPAVPAIAIRTNLRRRPVGGGTPSPCTAGNYNDHDDLVFAVAP